MRKLSVFYATSLTFPSALANRKQVVNQMRAFCSVRPDDAFTLGVAIADETLRREGFTLVESNSTALPLVFVTHLAAIRRKEATHVYCREIRLLTLLILAKKLRLLPKNLVFCYETHSLALQVRLHKIVLPYVEKHIVVTRPLGESLQAIIGSQRQYLVEHDAADPSIFHTKLSKRDARNILRIQPDANVLVYTGRFRTMGMDKGLLSVIRVVAELQAQGQEVVAYAVGGSDEEIEYYTNQAKEYGAEHYCMFVPYQSQSVVAEYHAAADILLMPFPHTEHFAIAMSPLKLFEYLMAGRPIIATALPSIMDVVSESSVSLIKPDSDDALLSAIMSLLKDPAHAALIAHNAQKLGLNYTWDKRGERILDFISS